jgi:hypothetical protein
MLNVEWFLQGFAFCSDLKILPLKRFDMIVGIDWLEKHSPMKIPWAQKWLTISYLNTHVTLQGLLPGVVDCHMVELFHISVDVVSHSTDCDGSISGCF